MTESRERESRERRRHERFPLGLPVRIQFEDREPSLLAELVDISKSGARFGASIGDVHVHVHVDDHVAFGFVMPDRPTCHAKGQVVRVEGTGQFVLALDDINEGFVGFIRLLEANS